MCNAENRARIVRCAFSLMALAPSLAAATLCVNPDGSHGCYKTIQAAVNNSKPNA
jgi:hypothetical protein